ncbi:MAG: isocitrate lyase [Isosphaeraceae bacterium]
MYYQVMPTSDELARRWATDSRWAGVRREYSPADVVRLRGSLHIESTLARRGAERLWRLLKDEPYVHALGALSGNQALQMVDAGLKAIYLSGWQVAADANSAGQMYPDQSLYPSNSVPALVRAINNTLRRADQVQHAEGRDGRDYFAPIVADGEAGFGGPLNAFELMKAMIEAGAAGVHFEDQLASEKKCGHMGGKVLVSTGQFIRVLNAARLAADTMDVPTVLVARTDANGARLITSDIDDRDRPFLTGERTPEGFYRITGGLDAAIDRGLSYAPYADLVWCETSEPDLEEARRFADEIHDQFPGKLLAYNCSPSFNWKAKLDDTTIARFQRELAAMGYRFQFVTLAGFHALNLSMYELARAYQTSDMAAYATLQASEFQREAEGGYQAVKHQRFVGTGYFDQIAQCIAGGRASTTALEGSTEEEQFATHAVRANGR